MSPLSIELESSARTPLRHGRCHYLTRCRSTWTCWCLSCWKICSDRRKNHGCGQKKPEDTSSAKFSVWAAANSSVVPTESAAEPTTKMKSSKANFVTWTFRLPPKRHLSVLLNFFFPFKDIWYFFSSSNLHFCRTESFLLNKLSFKKKNLFFKSDGVHAISRQEKRWSAQKALRDFPPRKQGIFHPLSGCLKTSFPSPRVCTGGRAGGRTLTSQSKFLGSIGYQICLAMVLRSWLRYNVHTHL